MRCVQAGRRPGALKSTSREAQSLTAAENVRFLSVRGCHGGQRRGRVSGARATLPCRPLRSLLELALSPGGGVWRPHEPFEGRAFLSSPAATFEMPGSARHQE